MDKSTSRGDYDGARQEQGMKSTRRLLLMAGKSFTLSIISPATHWGEKMERIYDTLQRIQSLWIELERTKPGTSEYVALMDQIRSSSDEYRALIDAPKMPRESKQELYVPD
jgi:hypothetical protein